MCGELIYWRTKDTNTMINSRLLALATFLLYAAVLANGVQQFKAEKAAKESVLIPNSFHLSENSKSNVASMALLDAGKMSRKGGKGGNRHARAQEQAGKKKKAEERAKAAARGEQDSKMREKREMRLRNAALMRKKQKEVNVKARKEAAVKLVDHLCAPSAI